MSELIVQWKVGKYLKYLKQNGKWPAEIMHAFMYGLSMQMAFLKSNFHWDPLINFLYQIFKIKMKKRAL